MSPRKKLIISFPVIFVVLTIISTYVRDFAGYSILVGIGLLIVGYFIGGGFSGYINRGPMLTAQHVKAIQRDRYYSSLPRVSIIVMMIGAVMFGAGILGYLLNSAFFPPY